MSIRHFPFTMEPYKTQMGLKPLNIKEWIEIDGERATHLKLKAQIIKDHEAIVLNVLDEATALEPVLEFHAMLWEHLQTHHTNDIFPAPQGTPTSAKGALAETATWVQEDFCLLSPSDQTLMAGVVCFPSRWKLSDKIGKNSDGIHKPVKHFAPIAKATATSLKQFPQPLTRYNWTIHDSRDLFCPEAHHRAPVFKPSEILQNVFLRIERQTLRRLPKTQAVVFSIRTYIHRLDEVIADSDRRARLKSTLESLPREIAEYKGMGFFFDDLKKSF